KAGAYPLTDYVPLLNPMPDGFQLRESWNETTRGSINGVARDDDIDYTILGLFLLETHGADLSAAHVADEWLDRLPYTQTYTAERVAYRNLVNGISPEEAGERRNPYREWIGAQIRGDIFGYTHPGKPREAALAAHADAYLSHRGNGIYGEMWAAALIAAAFTAESAYAAVLESQHHIPPNSRLAEALRMVIAAYDADLSWDTALDEIMQTYGHYDWVHTINNAAVLTAGLLWGDGDFTRSIALTVQAGLDTDSNGATAGSFAGALNGAARVPAHWVDPFHDTVRSSIRGFDGSRISELADRTRSAASSD
ncbi:MAG: hypothetical protein QOH23_712, partial [Gaiellaceae bacterium]|nr:hypothetical protein [Gaiellaceae bacterium]